MAQLQDFLQYVLPYVPGCSDPLAEQFIRDICIDFCAGSSIVQFTHDPISLVAGQTEYDIDTPQGTEATLILAASYRGMPMRVLKTGDNAFNGREIPAGNPSALLQSPKGTFTLDRTPESDQANVIQMLVSTKPKRTATGVDDVLLEYAYEIGQGVLGRLMLMPGQEFTKPEAAAVFTSTYNAAKVTARIRGERSFGAAGTSVRPRAFG